MLQQAGGSSAKDCFFGGYTAQDCCATGKNADGVSCWNDEFTIEGCCPPGAPVRAPPTASPAGVNYCAVSADDNCWGNEYNCQQCCDTGFVLMAGPSGPMNVSCWSNVQTGSPGIVAAGNGDFMVRGNERGVVTVSGQDSLSTYGSLPPAQLPYILPNNVALFKGESPVAFLSAVLADSACKQKFEPLGTSCTSSVVDDVQTEAIQPNIASDRENSQCAAGVADRRTCAQSVRACWAPLARCIISWTSATFGIRQSAGAYEDYLIAWQQWNQAGAKTTYGAQQNVTVKPMTRDRCCKKPPSTRPPQVKPTMSPTTLSPTRLPTLVPTGLPTTLTPTESPSTPTPSSQAPTYETCNTIICPESKRGSEEAVNAGCNAYHAGSGIITDGFWTSSPSTKIDLRDGPYLPNPLWTGQYPPNWVCRWTIYGSVLPQGIDQTRAENNAQQGSDASRRENIPRPIVLNFDEVSLEKGYDWLKVYDANLWSNTAQRGSSELTYIGWQRELKSIKNVTCDLNVGAFNSRDTCFRTPLAPVTARDGVMYITFQTDSSMQMRGFNLSFTVADPAVAIQTTTTTLRTDGLVYTYGDFNARTCPVTANSVTLPDDCAAAARTLTRAFLTVNDPTLPRFCSIGTSDSARVAYAAITANRRRQLYTPSPTTSRIFSYNAGVVAASPQTQRPTLRPTDGPTTPTTFVIFNSHPTGDGSSTARSVCFSKTNGATFASATVASRATLAPTRVELGSCKGKGTQSFMYIAGKGQRPVPTGQFSAGLPYEESASCEWLIFKEVPTALPTNGNLVSSDVDVTITFQKFDTESGFDELVIFNGATGEIVAKLSGAKTRLPGPYTIPGGFARIRFASDFSLNGAGFLASYTFTEKGAAANMVAGATVDESEGSSTTIGDSRIVTVMAVGVVAAVLMGIVGVVLYRSKRLAAKRPKVTVELPEVQPEVVAAKARNVW